MAMKAEERRARDRKYAATRRAKRTPEEAEKHREYCRRWHAEHREAANARRKERYLERFAKERLSRIRWAQENPDKRRVAMRKQYLKNRERILAYNKRWKDANPDSRHAHDVKRRALEKGALGSFTGVEFAELCARFDGACAYCGVKERLEADHNVPLSRGGSNDITNIVPACGTCNRRKHTKTADEFLAVAR